MYLYNIKNISVITEQIAFSQKILAGLDPTPHLSSAQELVKAHGSSSRCGHDCGVQQLLI